MDFFGYTLWSELYLGHPDWFSSLNLGDPEEFDPEGDFWPKIFDGLQNVLKDAGLNPNMGGCFHISSSIANQTVDEKIFNIFPHYIAARDAFVKTIPFELGVHAEFNDTVNPLGKKFLSSISNDLENTKKIGASTLVVHPSRNFSYPYDVVCKLMVDEATQPELNSKLRETKIILAWENMIEGQFSSLSQLLRFQEQVFEKLKSMGEGDLIAQHKLCLDTGHLLIWKDQHLSASAAKHEIDTYLPQFAQETKVFHIHGNDGSKDYHITPRSTEFMEHKTRAGLNLKKFQENSTLIEEWLSICNRNAKQPNRHIHLETDKVPFSLHQTIEFGKMYNSLK